MASNSDEGRSAPPPAGPEYSYIRYQREGETALVTIDNPPVNALHPDVADEIRTCAEIVARDRTFRSMVLTGTGRCFVAGGDIRFFTTIDRAGAERMALRVQAMQQALFSLRVPVIAVVNGHALGGGCELMLSCDIVIAEDQATIGVPEVTLGLIPGAGGTQMLFQSMASGTAKRLLFTGDRITAREAQTYGLVDQITGRGEGLSVGLELAERINRAGPLAVEAAKKSANFALRHSMDAGHRREAAIFSALFETDDHREGISAFLGGRGPQFEGR
jgi:enoyl-CoA hydratase